MRSLYGSSQNPVRRLRDALRMSRPEFAAAVGSTAPNIERFETELTEEWLRKFEECAQGNGLLEIAAEFAQIRAERAGQVITAAPSGAEEVNALQILRRLRDGDAALYKTALNILGELQQVLDIRQSAEAEARKRIPLRRAK